MNLDSGPASLLVLLTACSSGHLLPSDTETTQGTEASTAPTNTTTNSITSASSQASGSTASGSTTSGSTTSGDTISGSGTSADEPCSVWSQDCPSGEKCMPYSAEGSPQWDTFGCYPIDRAPDNLGDPCTKSGRAPGTQDSCPKGAFCALVSPGADVWVCQPFCSGSPGEPGCPEKSFCNFDDDSGYGICYDECDPLMQNCNWMQGCMPLKFGFGCTPDTSGPSGTLGSPCEYYDDCDPGLMCVDSFYLKGCAAPGCCSPYCSLSDEGNCIAPNSECVPWADVGWDLGEAENVGVCGSPSTTTSARVRSRATST